MCGITCGHGMAFNIAIRVQPWQNQKKSGEEGSIVSVKILKNHFESIARRCCHLPWPTLQGHTLDLEQNVETSFEDCFECLIKYIFNNSRILILETKAFRVRNEEVELNALDRHLQNRQKRKATSQTSPLPRNKNDLYYHYNLRGR
jgi:hypothetical protein